jgi:uncharacterized SAM-binding protein YcdF (DUF218 family)
VTQLVDLLFSSGGLICVLAAALLWVRLRERSAPARRFLVCVFLGYTIVSIHPISYSTGRLLTRGFRPFNAADVPAGRTAIILLGSSTYLAHDWEENTRATPDRTGTQRVIEAARVYRMVKPEWVISSGGRVRAHDGEVPSAVAMRAMLIELGIPESRILLEAESRNTHEEAVVIRRMLPSIPAERFVLVTSDLHMRRALGAFRAEGIEATPAIARRPQSRTPWDLNWLPSEAGLSEARAVAHEFLGICYYFARGWYRSP